MGAFGADDGTPTPHAFGVDNTACSFHSPQEHAFGVDDNPLISIPFSEWVTSTEIYWSTLAKRSKVLCAPVVSERRRGVEFPHAKIARFALGLPEAFHRSADPAIAEGS
jgi:hypothetical protein